jgi:lysophospholipase L1-like esterase
MLKKIFIGYIILPVIGSTCYQSVTAQEGDYYLGRAQYGFIAYNQNAFILPVADSNFTRLFTKIDSIIVLGNGKIQIVHLGGSHIQADIYTHVIRQHLQELSPDMNGGRGLVFPDKIAHLNNPTNFGVFYTGSWDHCLSTQQQNPCRLGLTGIAVTTSDSLATIIISPNKESLIHYTFNQIRVFHEPSRYSLYVVSHNTLIAGVYDSLQGFTLFRTGISLDTLKLIIQKHAAESFTLQGISLDSDSPGIVYNAIGVNGAMLSSYLRCELYSEHLQAIHPDLVIISIGTNDGYTRLFDTARYAEEYATLIEETRKVVPEAAFLLTVPNDSYLYRRYANPNTEKMRKIIYKLAETYNCAIWDFYSVMGGFNSSQAWRSVGLMQHDKIHFNTAGYELKGELFYSAFLKSWENHLTGSEVITGVLNTMKNEK